MNCIDKVLTDEEIDNLVNEIMNIPVEKNNNCLSSYGSINVDELISVVKEMQKIPTYDNLLKENQKLKKEKRGKREFVEYLEEAIKIIIEGNPTNISEYTAGKLDALKETLSKYKEIIGDKE